MDHWFPRWCCSEALQHCERGTYLVRWSLAGDGGNDEGLYQQYVDSTLNSTWGGCLIDDDNNTVTVRSAPRVPVHLYLHFCFGRSSAHPLTG